MPGGRPFIRPLPARPGRPGSDIVYQEPLSASSRERLCVYISSLGRTLRSAFVLAAVPLEAHPPGRWAARTFFVGW